MSIKEIIISICIVFIFGVIGYHYFDNAVQGTNYVINKTKDEFGIERERGLHPFKPMPKWVSSAAGSILGWAVKGLLKKLWIWLKGKYLSKRKRRRLK